MKKRVFCLLGILLIGALLLSSIGCVTPQEEAKEKAKEELEAKYQGFCNQFTKENVDALIREDFSEEDFRVILSVLPSEEMTEAQLHTWVTKMHNEQAINQAIKLLVNELTPIISPITQPMIIATKLLVNELTEQDLNGLGSFLEMAKFAQRRHSMGLMYGYAYDFYWKDGGKEAIEKYESIYNQKKRELLEKAGLSEEEPERQSIESYEKRKEIEQEAEEYAQEKLTDTEKAVKGIYEEDCEQVEAIAFGGRRGGNVEQWDPEWVETWTWDPEEGYPQTDVMNPPE
jgi:hypothetical protein